MRRNETTGLFDLFDTFLQEFLLNGNSILTDHKSILSVETFQMTMQSFDYQKGKGSFDQKLEKQFATASFNAKLIFAHAEWLWCYSVADIKPNTKQGYTTRRLGLESSVLKDGLYPAGSGHAGQWHTTNKPSEIRFTLVLLKFLYEKVTQNEIHTIQELKGWIEAVCLYVQCKQRQDKYQIPQAFIDRIPKNKLAVSNIYLFLLNPDEYENIASADHKRLIVDAFYPILPVEVQQNTELNIEQRLFRIREQLTTILGKDDFTFYESELQQVWDLSSVDKSFTPIQGLQYKKSVVLFGPPGTGKTYSAKRLAKSLIMRFFLREQSNVLAYLQNKIHLDDNIHLLQMHPSYTYEDFIAGYQLTGHETVATKGTFLTICETARKDLGPTPAEDKPHVLILDEINRVDLSRLFGEVFSALENRDEPIKVAIGEFELIVPRNLYVIGTMNEIDFSLERVDFALRRRFVWYFYGYEEDALRSMISDLNKKLNAKMKMGEEMELFIRNCSELNQKIDAIPDLGSNYQIGHTLFAEIVPIYKEYKSFNGYKSLKSQIFRSKGPGPADILWELSIEPMLKAFLGNLNTEVKANRLKELKKIFLQAKVNE